MRHEYQVRYPQVAHKIKFFIGDVRSLVKSINEILLHPENYDSGNCRSRAEKHFDKDIQFGKYIDLYEALLSRKANVLDL